MADIYVATDWRGRRDYAPVVVVKVDYVELDKVSKDSVYAETDFVPRFSIIGLTRFTGGTYAQVLEFIDRTLLRHDAIVGKDVEVSACINGVGGALDMMVDELDMLPTKVYIVVGGVATYKDDTFTIPRAELYGALGDAYETKSVVAAKGLRLLPVLNDQLLDLQTRSERGGHPTYDPDSEAEIELARALSIAIWMARQDHSLDTRRTNVIKEAFGLTGKKWDVFGYAKDASAVSEE